jgi:hypothetical protein
METKLDAVETEMRSLSAQVANLKIQIEERKEHEDEGAHSTAAQRRRYSYALTADNNALACSDHPTICFYKRG